MVTETTRFSGRDYQIIKCNNHKPTRVTYKLSYKLEEVWRVWYNDYILNYIDGKTYLQKANKGAERVQDYYQHIKKFDYELPFAPEEFPGKLKTMLTFL